jgi:hypothetical protein
MITLLEQAQLAQRAEFRRRVQQALLYVAAGVVLPEDPATLPGGLAEHRARRALARRIINAPEPSAALASWLFATQWPNIDPLSVPDINVVGMAMEFWTRISDYDPHTPVTPEPEL